MANLGFILKESVMDAVKDMDDKDFRKTLTALFRYAVYGEEPTDDLSTVGKIVFKMERPSIDYNNKKWNERRLNYE